MMVLPGRIRMAPGSRRRVKAAKAADESCRFTVASFQERPELLGQKPFPLARGWCTILLDHTNYMDRPAMSTQKQDPSERREALDRLAHAARAISAGQGLFHARAAEAFGMGSSDWKALGLIAQHGPISHRDLVGHLRLKPASVTNILDRLQTAGWIVRRRSSEDGRSIEITADEARLGAFRGQVFGPLMARLGDVYASYSDTELILLAGAFEKIAEAQRKAAEDVTSS